MSRAKELVAAFDVFNGKYRREEVEVENSGDREFRG